MVANFYQEFLLESLKCGNTCPFKCACSYGNKMKSKNIPHSRCNSPPPPKKNPNTNPPNRGNIVNEVHIYFATRNIWVEGITIYILVYIVDTDAIKLFSQLSLTFVMCVYIQCIIQSLTTTPKTVVTEGQLKTKMLLLCQKYKVSLTNWDYLKSYVSLANTHSQVLEHDKLAFIHRNR